MERWLKSSVEDRESFPFSDDMGCTEVSSICSKEIDDPSYDGGWGGLLCVAVKLGLD